MYSCVDLMDGFYQILMRERDVPFTAVSTPSGMLWGVASNATRLEQRSSHVQ